MIDIPTLKTPRTILRPWRTSDAEAVYEYARVPEATRYVLFNTHRSIQDAIDFVADAPNNPHRGYAVTLEGSDRAMGGCGLHPVPEHKKAEIGYILHPDIWGQGYATEIVKELIRHGFEDLGFQRLYSRVDERNIASWRVMEKNNMQREALLRQDMIIRGEAANHFMYAILKSDWVK